MKTTFKLSALALVMALTACSSGGGSSPSAVVDKAKDTTEDKIKLISGDKVEDKTEDKTKDKVEDKTEDKTKDKVEDKTEDKTKDKVEDKTEDKTKDKVEDKTEDKTKDKVEDKTEDNTKGKIEDKTEDKTKDKVEDKIEPQFTAKSGSYWYFDGAQKRSFSDVLKTANGNTLVIDGNTFQLANYDQNGQKELINGYFGYGVKDFGVDGKESIVVYSFGTLTNVDKIPQSGTATYKGDAIYGSEAISGLFTTEAKSELSVDFGAKTVNGRVYSTAHNIDEKFPTAKISGNTFIGGSDRKGSSLVRGHFFGANAEEIGGIYANDDQGSVASFGAKKQ